MAELFPKTVMARLSGHVLGRLYAIQDELRRRGDDRATLSAALRYCIENAPLPGREPRAPPDRRLAKAALPRRERRSA
jgi:hypothetical protein